MAVFKANQADNYGGGSGIFFSLKSDKEVRAVRFMYETMDDIEGIAFHQVEINGRRINVECLREHGQPAEVCPLCETGYQQLAKIFIPVYDIAENAVKIWERGKSYITRFSSLCARYSPLVGTIFEVERNGAKGDTDTKYEIFQIENDNTVLEDLPPILNPFDEEVVLRKTAEEMDYFLDYGKFEEVRGRNPATDRRKSSTRENVTRRTARDKIDIEKTNDSRNSANKADATDRRRSSF